MEKFIIVFYSEPDEKGRIELTAAFAPQSGPYTPELLQFNSSDSAKDYVKNNCPHLRAQIVPVLTNNGDETYV